MKLRLCKPSETGETLVKEFTVPIELLAYESVILYQEDHYLILLGHEFRPTMDSVTAVLISSPMILDGYLKE